MQLTTMLTIIGKGCARQAEEGENIKALILYSLITQAIERRLAWPAFCQLILQAVKGINKDGPIRYRSASYSTGSLKKFASILAQPLRTDRS
jgi:hypothetical protein